MLFSPIYRKMTKMLGEMPGDDWMGHFPEIRDTLVTGCYLLRAARSGEPLSISSEDIQTVIAILAS